MSLLSDAEKTRQRRIQPARSQGGTSRRKPRLNAPTTHVAVLINSHQKNHRDMQWQERTQKIWRQTPAIRKLPEVLRKYGIEVDPAPFEKLAKYVEEREEYMWGELQKLLQGLGSGDCVLERRKVRKSEVIRLKCPVHNGKTGATLLEEAVETLYDALPEAQKQWLKENGEKLLIGFEMADVGLRRDTAELGTTDGLNVLLYALAKYATGKRLKRLYILALDITKRGARPLYRLEAEATLKASKKMLYEAARKGLPLPQRLVETFRSPAAWLGLLLGDGVMWPRAIAISTDVPELIQQLIPYTAGLNRYAVTLRRFVANIVVKHAESVASLLDVLAEIYREAAPIEPKWARLRKYAARPIDAKTAIELYKNGIFELLGEVERKEENLAVFKRLEKDRVVYAIFAKIDGQWHAAQAKFRYDHTARRWRARIATKNLKLIQTIKEKLGIKHNISQRKDGRYQIDIYTKTPSFSHRRKS